MIAAIFFIVMGLTAAGIWTDVVGYSVNLLPADVMEIPDAYSREAFQWGRLASGIALIAFARCIPKLETTIIVAVSMAMSVATGALILSYHQTLFDPNQFAWASVFIASCGYKFIVSIFYIYFAGRIKTELAVWGIVASLVLETVCSVLISLYCTPATQAIIVVAAPITVATCYFVASRIRFETAENISPQTKAQGFERTALIIELLILTAALVFVRALSTIGVWGKSRSNFIGMMELSVDELVAIAIIVSALAYLVFVLPRKRFSLSMRCVIGFAVLLAGLQLFAFTDDLQFGYSFDVVTTAVELFAHLVMWMMTIECIRQTDIPAFRIVGFTSPVYAILSLAWVTYFEEGDLATSTIVMVIVYFLFLCVMVFLFMGGNQSKGSLLRSRPTSATQEAMRGFEDAWGLSPRESEIFELLLQGKKRSEIEQRCSLSEGTVKTHISNLYRKLDVHSKRDMADLFEKETRTGEAKPD